MAQQIKIPVLVELKNRISNMAPLYRRLASDLHAAVEKNFKVQGRPKWVPLAKSTIRDRKRKGYWPGKILQREGGGSGLLGSITERYSENSAEVGSNKSYAAIHQFGGTIRQSARSSSYKQNRYTSGRRKGKFKKGTSAGQGHSYRSRTIRIPARPFLKVTGQDVKVMEKTAVNYLLGK